MENHPIPQDITGFQFKLIGSISVKQFIYIAVGVIFSWLLFVSSIFFLIKYLLILIFAGGGIALAFIPIEGRPMDTMILNFIKAYFRNTTYVYQKSGNDSLPQQKIESPKIDIIPTAPAASPSLHKQAYQMPPRPEEVTATKPPPPTPPPTVEQSPPPPAPRPTLVETTAKESSATIQQAPLPEAPIQSIQENPSHVNIRQVPASQTASVGIPITPEVPNLVTGIIKDPRGNPLANILVEVKDKEGNPVRAFKTNGLGHFASATPLMDGAYTIDFEDIKGENKFQRIAFDAKGQILMPFEVISTDKREELRRELFN